MRFWVYLDFIESDTAKGLLTKAYERQKFFLEAVLQDYLNSIMYLDYIPEGGSLLMMR